MGPMPHERRSTRRSALPLAVTCHIESNPGFIAQTLDISPTGALLRSEALCAIGTPVTLVFGVDALGEMALVPGTVRRLVPRALGRPAAIGISFDFHHWEPERRARFFSAVGELVRRGEASF